MKTFKFLLIFLFLSQAFANDLRGICFDRSTSLKSVVSYSSQITAPGDKLLINQSKHCIEIVADEKRMDLYDKFIGMNFKIIRRYGNSIESEKRECLFEIENIKNTQLQKTAYGVSKKPFANQDNSDAIKKTTTSLRIMESKTAQFMVNRNLVTITCRPRAKYSEVDISLGSENTNVITTIQIQKNQRVNLAKVVEDLSQQNNQKKITTNSNNFSITNETSSGNSVEEFYLTLK